MSFGTRVMRGGERNEYIYENYKIELHVFRQFGFQCRLSLFVRIIVLFFQIYCTFREIVSLFAIAFFMFSSDISEKCKERLYDFWNFPPVILLSAPWYFGKA